MKKTKEIEFDAGDLITAVEDVRDHVKGKRKVTLRTTKVSLPDPAPAVIEREPACLRAVAQRSDRHGG
jgi:hypothetical protein